MTKAELIKEIARESNISLRAATKAINAVQDAIFRELTCSGVFTWHGVGKLSTTFMSARMMNDPRGGEKMHVAARKSVGFRSSKQLKAALNSKIKK